MYWRSTALAPLLLFRQQNAAECCNAFIKRVVEILPKGVLLVTKSAFSEVYDWWQWVRRGGGVWVGRSEVARVGEWLWKGIKPPAPDKGFSLVVIFPACAHMWFFASRVAIIIRVVYDSSFVEQLFRKKTRYQLVSERAERAQRTASFLCRTMVELQPTT